MKHLNHKGLSLLETLASITIVIIVMSFSLTILIQVRNHSLAAKEQLIAQQISSFVFDEISRLNVYDDVINWQNGEEKLVNKDNCATSPIPCSIFNQSFNNKLYDDFYIVFVAPTDSSLFYKLVHFQIVFEYYSNRTLHMSGVLYDKA